MAVAFLLAVLFIAKFAGPSILRLYVEAGMGNVGNQPIFSTVPQEEIVNPQIASNYLAELTPYNYPDMEILLPKKFSVTKETKTRAYYKKRKIKDRGDVIYILCKNPNFFTGLFPLLQKQGINNNYDFVKYTLGAKTQGIKNTTDAFFAIMKSVFTPDMGDQKNLKILKFSLADKKGFITYNLANQTNYFDCNLTDNQGNFFKVYIKDTGVTLDLEKVFTIISTIKKLPGEEIAH